jgi:ribosomal protein L31
MKNKISYCFIVIFFAACTKKTTKCVMSAEKYNIMMVNADNPIAIAISGTKHPIYTLSTDNGKVTFQYGKYYVTPQNVGFCNLSLKTITGEEYKMPFRVVPVGKIMTYLCTKDLIVQYSIRCITPYIADIDFDIKMTMLSFTLTIRRNNIVIDTYTNQGNYFDNITQKMLDNCLVGDEVIFDKVFVQFKNGNVEQAEPLSYVVKPKQN